MSSCEGSILESEGNDRADINLPGQQLQLLQDAANSAHGLNTVTIISLTPPAPPFFISSLSLSLSPFSCSGPLILALYNAGPLDISWAKNSPRVMAILENFFPAQTAGTALANIITGSYNPAGRLPNTWPASLNQVLITYQ